MEGREARWERRPIFFKEHVLGNRDCLMGDWNPADIDENDRRVSGMRNYLGAEIENFNEFGVTSTEDDYGQRRSGGI